MISAKARLTRRDKMLHQVSSLRDTKPPSDPAICTRCNAIWHKGNWSLDPAVRRATLRWQSPVKALCPACRQIREDNPAGILYLAGSYFWQNRSQILQCIQNSERNALQKNPLERIIHTDWGPKETFLIETTSEKLARRLGRAVHRAHHGHLEIRFSDDDHLVRVYWHRNLEESSTHA
ncbi:MAG: ATPase [candidate division NC10 bacterium]|nr:ATPase [candidate division NC10 bacterium]